MEEGRQLGAERVPLAILRSSDRPQFLPVHPIPGGSVIRGVQVPTVSKHSVPGRRLHGAYSTATTSSTSTGASRGREGTPTEVRAGRPASPNTSTRRSV